MKFSFTRSRLSSLRARLCDIAIRIIIRNTAKVFESRQFKIACIPTDFIGRVIISEGVFSRLELELLAKILYRHQQSGAMLDIGANIGNHSIFLSDLFEQVISFEPFPSNAALLRANILLSNRTNIIVEEVGLGSSRAMLSYSVNDHDNTGSGRFSAAQSSDDLLLSVEVGDEIIKTKYPEISSGKIKVRFVKCDVEGFEPEALQGISEIISQQKPIVFYESNNPEKGRASMKILEASGYKYFYEFRRNDYPCCRILREIRRILYGEQVWPELIEKVPNHSCDILASTDPLSKQFNATR